MNFVTKNIHQNEGNAMAISDNIFIYDAARIQFELVKDLNFLKADKSFMIG